jgi:hypothetical protein
MLNADAATALAAMPYTRISMRLIAEYRTIQNTPTPSKNLNG